MWKRSFDTTRRVRYASRYRVLRSPARLPKGTRRNSEKKFHESARNEPPPPSQARNRPIQEARLALLCRTVRVRLWVKCAVGPSRIQCPLWGIPRILLAGYCRVEYAGTCRDRCGSVAGLSRCSLKDVAQGVYSCTVRVLIHGFQDSDHKRAGV